MGAKNSKALDYLHFFGEGRLMDSHEIELNAGNFDDVFNYIKFCNEVNKAQDKQISVSATIGKLSFIEGKLRCFSGAQNSEGGQDGDDQVQRRAIIFADKYLVGVKKNKLTIAPLERQDIKKRINKIKFNGMDEKYMALYEKKFGNLCSKK